MEKAAVYLGLRIILSLQQQKGRSCNKVSDDKSFVPNFLGGGSKAVRLNFCIEFQLLFSFAYQSLPLGAGSHLKLLAFERVQLLKLR